MKQFRRQRGCRGGGVDGTAVLRNGASIPMFGGLGKQCFLWVSTVTPTACLGGEIGVVWCLYGREVLIRHLDARRRFDDEIGGIASLCLLTA